MKMINGNNYNAKKETVFIMITIVAGTVIPQGKIVKQSRTFTLTDMNGVKVYGIRTESSLESFFTNCGFRKQA